jgi:very-short-patch-repair endonuclease
MVGNDSTKTDISLAKIKGKQMHGYDFHRQKPIDSYIVLSRGDVRN